MSLPDYAALTRDDPNPIKRWFQARRLADAMAALPAELRPLTVVDYGAGDGELARRLAARWPEARVIAYEPAGEFAEAARRQGGVAEVIEDAAALPPTADLVVCTEVFEHLPSKETATAINRIAALAGGGGHVLIGVPMEVGPPALAKGMFRRARRPQDQDGRWAAIWGAASGRELAGRDTVLLTPELAYHPGHVGFDHRVLADRLAERFERLARRGSPWSWGPTWMNAEVYWLLRARG